MRVLHDACGMYLIYNYDVILSLTNESSEEAVGWVKVVLVDFTEGKPLATSYIVIRVPGETTQDVSYSVWFATNLDEELITEVLAEVISGEVEDVTCNGIGKIPLNSLPLVNTLEQKLEEIGRVEKPLELPTDWWDEE